MSFIRRHPDRVALLLLFFLWLLFFWRIYTPNRVDAVSLQEGDFSGQFVSWTSYAAERWSDGELPLWNPYMHAGAPFLADPQTAVLYPPRQLTLTVLAAGGDFSGARVFAALQYEMTLHVLAGILFMYVCLRHLTTEYERLPSVLASMMGASVFGFGGYFSAYPQLQLPILETAIWFPLVMLGIHEATRHASIRWRWLMGAGVALALAVLAGHPQTFVLMGYTAVAYLAYRLRGMAWRRILVAIIVLGIITAGLSAAQLLPSLEFQQSTYRQGFSVDDKSGGFPFQDIVQLVFPRMLGDWSPLYMGLATLLAIGVAIGRRVTDVIFWTGLAVVGLVLSFGSKFALYQILYVLLPGFSLFRGQERSVVLVVMAASVLAAQGIAALASQSSTETERRNLRVGLAMLLLLSGGFSVVFFFLRLIPPNGELYQNALQVSIYAFAIMIVVGIVFNAASAVRDLRLYYVVGIVVLLVFDLFSVNLTNPNFEPVAAEDRLPQPDYITVMQVNTAPGQHVEGLRGIRDSYGALYRVPDIWGNSPLRLDGVEFYLWDIPIEARWELLGVQVVNSEWDTLPVPHQAIGTGRDVEGDFTIYQLTDPRPFAHLVYETRSADAEQTRQLLQDSDFRLREVVLLPPQDRGIVPRISYGTGTTTVAAFSPEYIEIQAETDTTAVLSLALPYAPGWQAEIDGESVEVLKAYDGLVAVVVPEGNHTITLRYLPLSFLIGAVISMLSVFGVIVGWFTARPQERND